MPGSSRLLSVACPPITRAVVLAASLTGVGIAVLGRAVQAQGPSHEQETGMLRWGSTVVWFRATDAGTVLVFASAGYRSAFAQPATLSPDDIDRWAALADQLAAGGTTHAEVAASTLADTARTELGGGDVVIESPAAANGAKLEVRIRATRPDVVMATLFPDAGTQAAAALRDAARAARSLRAAAGAAAAAAMIPPPATAAAQPPHTGSEPAPADNTPDEHAALPSRADGPGGAAGLPAAIPRSATDAPDNSTQSPPSRTTQPLRGATSAGRILAPARHTVRPANTMPTSMPVVATTTRAPLRVTAPALAAAVTPVAGSVRAGSAVLRGRAAPVASVHNVVPATGYVPAVGVDDAAVRNLVHLWQPELMYCYTQFGVREHPTLTGGLVVRIALSPSGGVGHSVISARAWNGGSGAAVETCIQSRIASWRFPPAGAGSMHEFTLAFAPEQEHGS